MRQIDRWFQLTLRFMSWWLLLLGAISVHSANTTNDPEITHIAVLTIKGPIGPATKDYFERSLKKAAGQNASALILKLDTPGGLDSTTRDMI